MSIAEKHSFLWNLKQVICINQEKIEMIMLKINCVSSIKFYNWYVIIKEMFNSNLMVNKIWNYFVGIGITDIYGSNIYFALAKYYKTVTNIFCCLKLKRVVVLLHKNSFWLAIIIITF